MGGMVIQLRYTHPHSPVPLALPVLRPNRKGQRRKAWLIQQMEEQVGSNSSLVLVVIQSFVRSLPRQT